MNRLKSRVPRRPAASESERSWLGAEALPGGALPREAEPSVAPAAVAAPTGGLAAWLAAALRWTRRGRLT